MSARRPASAHWWFGLGRSGPAGAGKELGSSAAWASALAEFQQAFGYEALDARGQFSAADIANLCATARLRGRADIAERLQLAAEILV